MRTRSSLPMYLLLCSCASPLAIDTDGWTPPGDADTDIDADTDADTDTDADMDTDTDIVVGHSCGTPLVRAVSPGAPVPGLDTIHWSHARLCVVDDSGGRPSLEGSWYETYMDQLSGEAWCIIEWEVMAATPGVPSGYGYGYSTLQDSFSVQFYGGVETGTTYCGNLVGNPVPLKPPTDWHFEFAAANGGQFYQRTTGYWLPMYNADQEGPDHRLRMTLTDDGWDVVFDDLVGPLEVP